MFVVFISQQCVSEIVAVRLNDLDLIGKVIIKVGIDVPVHASILAVKPVWGPNVVNLLSRDVITLEQLARCPVNVTRSENPLETSWRFPVKNKSSVC